MANPDFIDNDENASGRKEDHINLALKSQVSETLIDNRFDYEPMMASLPGKSDIPTITWSGFSFKAPIWISSMTGGTQRAKTINKRLAQACEEFGLGMGLGSCRLLLQDDTYLSDFAVRRYMPSRPLYANLGIAQVELLLKSNKLNLIETLINKLEANGLIIHVNPLQEWLQPEGDRYHESPLDTIKRVLDRIKTPLIIKEVGQGFGPRSIHELLKLPLVAIDFGASGGTNFALLELLRSDKKLTDTLASLTKVGHSASDMVSIVNKYIETNNSQPACTHIIISGGVKDFLDGFYLTQKCRLPSIYGQASAFLAPALQSYEHLQQHIQLQLKGLAAAYRFLRIKE